MCNNVKEYYVPGRVPGRVSGQEYSKEKKGLG